MRYENTPHGEIKEHTRPIGASAGRLIHRPMAPPTHQSAHVPIRPRTQPPSQPTRPPTHRVAIFPIAVTKVFINFEFEGIHLSKLYGIALVWRSIWKAFSAGSSCRLGRNNFDCVQPATLPPTRPPTRTPTNRPTSQPGHRPIQWPLPHCRGDLIFNFGSQGGGFSWRDLPKLGGVIFVWRSICKAISNGKTWRFGGGILIQFRLNSVKGYQTG